MKRSLLLLLASTLFFVPIFIAGADTKEEHIERADQYFNQNNFSQAIDGYTKAIDLGLNDPEIYYWRGRSYSNFSTTVSDAVAAISILDKAIADYTKAIDIKPDYADAYCDRGGAHWSIAVLKGPSLAAGGDINRSFADYKQAITLKPDFAKAYFYRSFVYVMVGNHNKAWDDVHKAKELGFNVDHPMVDRLKKISGRDN